jgi:hypothetical protein
MKNMENAMASSMMMSNVDLDKMLELSRASTINISQLSQHAVVVDKILASHNQQLDDQDQKIDDLVRRMEIREQNECVSSKQRKNIRHAVNEHVYKLMNIRKVRGKLDDRSKRIRKVYGSLLFSRLYDGLYEKFDVNSYDEIRATDYDEAMAFIKSWTPDDGMEALRQEAEENWEVNNPDCSVNEYLGTLC